MSLVPALLLIALAAALGAATLWIYAERHRKVLGSALEAAQNELKALQASQAQVIHTTKLASLGQMVAGVAHEINTPLGFVKSNVEVVGDLVAEYDALVSRVLSGVDLLAHADAATFERAREPMLRARQALAAQSSLADAKELLSDTLDGIRTIANLVANLKGFARVDRDGLDQVDLNESVKSALIVAQHQLRDRVKVYLQLGELPKVRCMPSQLNQVFLNLITNAAQAISGEGTLTIASRRSNGSVEVSFADTGSGIAEEVLPKIFDPFFTTKAVGEGTGLGLAIVHKIIKAHGGSIHVRTAVGQGTTFTISLPVEQKGAANAPQGKAA
jgi:signal transduction histidine kinase